MTFPDHYYQTQALAKFTKAIENFAAIPQDPVLIGRLRDSTSTDRCTLVLGAGASSSVGLPLWGKLVERLIERAFPEQIELLAPVTDFLMSAQLSPLRLVAHLGDIFQYKSTLWRLTRECLYENYEPSLEHVLLEPLCTSLLLSRSISQIQDVITYNFDSTLEECIVRLGGAPLVIESDEEYSKTRRGLRIYHPHGYLPFTVQEEGSDLVFAERDYHTQFSDNTAWTNVMQMHHLQSSRCIFVGLSLDDPNMRRLLDLQRRGIETRIERRHVAIQALKSSPIENFFLARQLGGLGVDVLWVRTHSETAETIRSCFA